MSSLAIRLLFVASFVAVGCAAAADPPSEPEPEPPAPPPQPKRLSLSFQVERDSELWDDATKAAAAWSAATGLTVTVSPDGDIPIFLVSELDPRCQDPGTARGCSRVVEDLTDSFTQIPTYLHWSVRYGTILHEMGHHLRGTAGHVPNPEALMYATRPLDHTTILPDDVAFICSGPRMQCPAELPV